MQAYRVNSFETPPALHEIETVTPGPGEVLIQIEACGLNYADLLMATGRYQDTPKPPFTLGMEVCGTVTACGDRVESPRPGTRVAVFGGSGGLANQGVFQADRCIAVPDAMPSEEAAGFVVAYGTSHLALTRRANLQSGERLLVLGAAGGVGLTAVEIGAAMGAEVIAVARGKEKGEVARKAGAAHVLDSDSDDIVAAVKALGGADVVYDPVGGDLFTAALKAANREARIIVIGFASGDIPQIPANILLVKNVTVIGFYWGGMLTFAPEAVAQSVSELFEMYGAGTLHPHVSHVLPLERAGEAFDLMRQRRSTGKVVVSMASR